MVRARSVIKSSRASDKKDSQLSKAVKQRNKAQRTNKVAAARGMDIDKVPVPMARKGAKTLSSKKKIKICQSERTKIVCVFIQNFMLLF